MVSLGDFGYISIHRQLTNHWLWNDKPFSKGQAWIDLILLANHKDHKRPKGDKIVTYKRGDVNQSVLFLADRWGWNRKTVMRFLRVLESDGMVVVRGTRKGTTITIVNYDIFQNKGTTKGTTHGTTRGTTDGTTHGTQTIMNNNDNNGNNGGDIPHPQDPPPTLEEIKRECRDEGYDAVDPEKFFSYYEGRNWKIGGEAINWRSMLRHWNIKDKSDTKKKKKPALDEDFWNELREKARKEDEEIAARKRDGAG